MAITKKVQTAHVEMSNVSSTRPLVSNGDATKPRSFRKFIAVPYVYIR
jgi:hypothetical protein